MAIVEKIREQLLILYTDDGSLIMKNLKKLVDSIDEYLERNKVVNAPHIVLQTIQEYDAMIQKAMCEYSVLAEGIDEGSNINKVTITSIKAQEVLSLITTLLHYIQYAKDFCLKNISPEHASTYRKQFEIRIAQLEEIAKKYQTIVSNMSKIIELATMRLHKVIKESNE